VEDLFTSMSVPLISGLLLYVIQELMVRSRLIDGLVLEINDLLENAQMIRGQDFDFKKLNI